MAAIPAEHTGSTLESLEALFRPSTRFRDSHGNRRDRLPAEIELLQDQVMEDVLATGISWKDLCRFLHDKVVWLTPSVWICVSSQQISDRDDVLVVTLGPETYENHILRVWVTPDTAAAAATATCGFLLRILTTLEQRDLWILGNYDREPAPISGAALSLFFQESRCCLRQVILTRMTLNEDLCLALMTMSRLDVVINMEWCSLADGAAGAFVECLQSDRGPIKLEYCSIGSQILANALTGDSRVTRFKPYFRRVPERVPDDADTAVLFRSLVNNRGLVDLDLAYNSISDENFAILCESLQAHPTLTSLDVRSTIRIDRFGVSSERNEARTRAVADMMEQNNILQTIHLPEGHYDLQIYLEEILPYLETNLHIPRVLAVIEIDDGPVRQAVLGRALYSVRSRTNLVWMFLSQNVDALVRPEEEEESNSEVQEAVAAAVVVAVVAVAGSKRKH
jgi:hypothetical protein